MFYWLLFVIVLCPSFINLLPLVTPMVSSNLSYICMIYCGENRNVHEITQQLSDYLDFKSFDLGVAAEFIPETRSVRWFGCLRLNFFIT